MCIEFPDVKGKSTTNGTEDFLVFGRILDAEVGLYDQIKNC